MPFEKSASTLELESGSSKSHSVSCLLDICAPYIACAAFRSHCILFRPLVQVVALMRPLQSSFFIALRNSDALSSQAALVITLCLMMECIQTPSLCLSWHLSSLPALMKSHAHLSIYCYKSINYIKFMDIIQ